MKRRWAQRDGDIEDGMRADDPSIQAIEAQRTWIASGGGFSMFPSYGRPIMAARRFSSPKRTLGFHPSKTPDTHRRWRGELAP